MKRIGLLCILVATLNTYALGSFGDWTCSVALSGYVSSETGKNPNAYMWVDETCEEVRFVVLAQQNMTEEALLRNAGFRKEMAKLGGALIWVAPWFSHDWSPNTGAQQTFEGMMAGLAGQSGHMELTQVPVVPFGHSAQATFPWNFAAWNHQRTLAIISFHGDAPRTNLCGYGTANVEWGRTRNIDGIPGLMVMGEYEWWQSRVTPALAFRMMYPESCISVLCDAGSGHFDLCDDTIDYIAKFIAKACEQRLLPDGALRQLNSHDGWLYGIPMGDSKESTPIHTFPTVEAAPWDNYAGDRHEAVWCFDEEMATITQQRYAETNGKRYRYVGIRYQDALVPYNSRLQGGMEINLTGLQVGDKFTLEAVFTDSTRLHTVDKERGVLHVDYICGPVRKVGKDTFELIPYDCGDDNPRRSHSAWLVAVGEGNKEYKRVVQPIRLKLR